MTAAGPLTSIASFPSGMHITKPALSFRIANARTRSLTSRSDVVPRELCVVPVSPNAAMLEGMVGNAQLVDGDGDGDGVRLYVGDAVNVGDGVNDGDAVNVGDGVNDGEAVYVGEAVKDGDGDGDAVGEAVLDGVGVGEIMDTQPTAADTYNNIFMAPEPTAYWAAVNSRTHVPR